MNMGNIYVEQGKYPQAIKMYRMALDQIGEQHKGVRIRITKSIGLVFVRMGQYADAITSLEHSMDERPYFKTGNGSLGCPISKLKHAFSSSLLFRWPQIMRMSLEY